MKLATQDSGYLTECRVTSNEDLVEDVVYGIKLGHASCMEHSRGIIPLLDDFGAPHGPRFRSWLFSKLIGHVVGADARTITRVPERLSFIENVNDYAYLFYCPTIEYQAPAALFVRELDAVLGLPSSSEDAERATAWDESGFIIRMDNRNDITGRHVLGGLYRAFQNRDIMLFLDPQPLHPWGEGGSSLTIAQRSRAPEHALSLMEFWDSAFLAVQQRPEIISA